MNEKKLKSQITMGVILIIVGILIFMKDFVADEREKIFNTMNLEMSELLASNNNSSEEETTSQEQSHEGVDEETNDQDLQEEKPQEEPNKEYETYVGILEIEKINFSKGFYKKESSLNNVKFNIKIIPQSDYPDEDKGNVIIIGHSGNYNNSYFANLHKLAIDDTAILKYNNKIYTYKIVNIYTEAKDGVLTIYRDETKNCLTLITCTKDDSKTQTIYIFELVSVE